MKKLLQSITLISAIAISIQALGNPACSSSDIVLNGLDSGRYEVYGESTKNDAIYFDTETIKIDKKNKTIDAWVINVLTTDGRNDFMRVDSSLCQNVGVTREYIRIFYAQNKSMTLGSSILNCDGSTIFNKTTSDSTTENIIPSSSTERLKNRIMQKYNLK